MHAPMHDEQLAHARLPAEPLPQVYDVDGNGQAHGFPCFGARSV